MRQAATDIVTILANPSATTVPSLDQVSVTNNALLKLAKILKRMDNVPTLEATLAPSEHLTKQYIAPAPRVQKPATLPRVQKSVSLLRVYRHVVSLQDPLIQKLTSNKLSPPTWQRNRTFKELRYNLKSTNFQSQAAQYLVAQETFNTHNFINHIYNDSGKNRPLAHYF